LLFPMNDLFERYVAAQLRRAIAGSGLHVVAQGGFAYCLGPWNNGGLVVGDSHATRPDILIKDGDRVVAVLDTKWKDPAKGVSHADLYQMMAYARLYACPHLILLYPAGAGEVVRDVDTRGIPPGLDRLDIATVPLHRQPSEIRDRLSQLLADRLPQDLRSSSAWRLPTPA
jgi:5-methylcytosine-specific restriction enzyme subunit McrC